MVESTMKPRLLAEAVSRIGWAVGKERVELIIVDDCWRRQTRQISVFYGLRVRLFGNIQNEMRAAVGFISEMADEKYWEWQIWKLCVSSAYSGFETVEQLMRELRGIVHKLKRMWPRTEPSGREVRWNGNSRCAKRQAWDKQSDRR